MYYKLQVSTTTTFDELAVNKLVEELTYDIITNGLEPNTLYYWRVKSINNLTGKESEWSSICQFRTRPLDIIIAQGSHNDVDEGINVIYYEVGRNKSGTCFAPIGKIGDKMCKSTSASCDVVVVDVPIGGDTLGRGLCGQHCSELL